MGGLTHLECYSLIRLSSKQKVLPLLVRRFNLLFVGSHESVPRHGPFNNFWVVNLCQQISNTGMIEMLSTNQIQAQQNYVNL